MKQMLQSKKTRTLLPLFLALLLTFLAVPFAASAEGETESPVTSYPAELLAKFSAFDAASKVVGDFTAENLTSQEIKSANKSIVRGTDDKTALVVADDAAGKSGGLVLNTWIPFGKDSTGTFEFYVKTGTLPEELSLYFGLMYGDTTNACYSRSIGFTFREKKGAMGYLNGYNIGGQRDGQWNADIYKVDGYTRFVMIYSNCKAELYVGDMSTPIYTATYTIGDDVWGPDKGYSMLLLTVGVHGKVWNNTASTVDLSTLKGQVVANFKDISVYNGALTPAQIDALYAEPTPAVRFEKADGTLIEKRELTDGSLTVENFPEITSEKTVCWFNKETGELVQAGATFEKDTVLVAREFGRNETVLVGAQDGAPANNKVNARFVGGVYDLSGDQIGFDIEVTYKDADGQAVVEKYHKEGSAVYTSLIAAGESYTANQKGVMYLFALTFEEIPVMAIEITFTVKPFKSNGSIRIYGETGSFTMVNGQFIDQPQA